LADADPLLGRIFREEVDLASTNCEFCSIGRAVPFRCSRASCGR
jgi:hypothetical protein